MQNRRHELGDSQMSLANRVGMHFSFVASTERGERNLSLRSLLVLAKGLDIDPAELVRGLEWSDEAVR